MAQVIFDAVRKLEKKEIDAAAAQEARVHCKVLLSDRASTIMSGQQSLVPIYPVQQREILTPPRNSQFSIGVENMRTVEPWLEGFNTLNADSASQRPVQADSIPNDSEQQRPNDSEQHPNDESEQPPNDSEQHPVPSPVPTIDDHTIGRRSYGGYHLAPPPQENQSVPGLVGYAPLDPLIVPADQWASTLDSQPQPPICRVGNAWYDARTGEVISLEEAQTIYNQHYEGLRGYR